MDKKYNFQKTENEMKQFWEQEEIYKYQNGEHRKADVNERYNT